jgi:hypothetical protein
MRGGRVRDAGSRFARSTDPAGIPGRLPAPARVKALGLTLLLAGLALLLIASSAGASTIHELETSFKLPGSPGRPTSIAIDEEAELLYILNLGEGAHRGLVERFDLEGNPIDYPGAPGFNESQSVFFNGTWAFGDTFTLTCPNGETTAPIQFDDSEFGQNIPGNVKTALEAKCGGTFSVSGSIFGLTVNFEGTFAETNVPKMTCAKVAGSGTCEIGNEQDGSSGSNGFRPNCNGEFNCSQIAVDNSGGPNQGVIYVSSRTGGFGAGVQVFLPDGTDVGPITNFPGYPEEFNPPAACGVAVDNEGGLYVTHSSFSLSFTFVDRYTPLEWATHHKQTVPATGTIRPLDFNNPCRTAIDSAKSLLISSGEELTSSGTLQRFAPDAFGPPVEPFKPGTSTSVVGSAREPAVDITNDDVYVPIAGKIARFDSNGSPIEEFGEGELSNEIAGLGVNGETGKVYVSDGIFGGPNEVRIYKPIFVPDAITHDPTGVLHSEAELHGHVDPAGAGEITGCEFQYVKDSLYNVSKFASATSVPCDPAAPLTSPTDVSAELSGLTVEEGFHYRLLATNANGTATGTEKAFMTRAVLGIKTESATNIAPRSVTLNGSFTGEGASTEYFYEWGTNQGYGNSTPVQTLPSPSGATQAPQALAGLELETLYHYRVVAVNSFGTSRGSNMTFTTSPAVTGLVTKPASSIDLDNITLNAEFQGDGLDTKYYFEYGLTTEYGIKTPEKDAGVTGAATPISAEIDQFNGVRTYHYRVIAINSFGKTEGQDLTFVAPELEKPGIENTQSVSVTPTTATVSTEVNPNHWATIYLFEWGETHAYGTATPFSEPIGGLDNEPIPVSQKLTGLTPGTIYFARAVAANFRGTTEGEEISFITPDVPRVDSSVSESVGKTTAHLGGLVAAVASPTSVSFQYGPSAAYGQSTPQVPIGESQFSHRVDADIGNLTPGTSYHFRISATNTIGTTYGPDQTFTTVAEPPSQKSTAECDKLSSRAKKKNKEAKQLRKKAKGAKGKRAQTLNRQANEASKQAKKLNREAEACRSSSGGSGK